MPEVGVNGWTDADQAELDVILWQFLGAAYAHLPCEACRERGHWCDPLSGAWDAIEGWLAARSLLSRAQHLRAAQSLVEDARRLVAEKDE